MSSETWLNFANKYREEALDIDQSWGELERRSWEVFCYKNVAFGEEMARMSRER